jgi:hypothetical protein
MTDGVELDQNLSRVMDAEQRLSYVRFVMHPDDLANLWNILCKVAEGIEAEYKRANELSWRGELGEVANVEVDTLTVESVKEGTAVYGIVEVVE